MLKSVNPAPKLYKVRVGNNQVMYSTVQGTGALWVRTRCGDLAEIQLLNVVITPEAPINMVSEKRRDLMNHSNGIGSKTE